MKLRWLRSGSLSLRRQMGYIATKNPEIATRMRRRIRSTVLRLLDFPQSGRVGHFPGTRELIITNLPYIVIYRISGDVVEILRVFHTSQEFSDPFH